MNGPSTVSHSAPTNEQSIGKFHVEKVPNNVFANHDDTAHVPVQTPASMPAPAVAPMHSAPATATDESTSRFQMIRVDRNFSRGRWKVNDYEPPENASIAINPPVNTIEIEPNNPVTYTSLPGTAMISNTVPPASLPTQPANLQQPILSTDSNVTSSATLAATAASAAAAAATAFQQQQQQQQQRLAMANPAAVVPTANVPNPAGLMHAFPPTGLPNMPATNQTPYLLANHPQYGYFPYYHHSPYHPHYPPQWAALAAHNPFLPPPPMPSATQLPGNLGDPNRHPDGVSDVTGDPSGISSNAYSNAPPDHLQNAQMAAAAAAAPFIYAAHHASYLPPTAPPTTASPYSTIAAYHPPPPQPTIIPPNQPVSIAQNLPSNPTETSTVQHTMPPTQQPLQAPQQLTAQQQLQLQTQQLLQQQQMQQQLQMQMQMQQQQQTVPVPMMTSPKHDVVKNPVQQQTISNPVAKAATAGAPSKPQTNSTPVPTMAPLMHGNPMTDLLSSSPSTIHTQSSQASLLSPITVQTTNPNVPPNPHPHPMTKVPPNPLNEMWPYAAAPNASYTIAHTAAQTAAAAMDMLNNETGKNREMADEILKELTTPTKQNNTTDIDNKISAAMDLVKMHLLSAVREEVTELRQQIRTLNDKVASVEHENAFLRQNVPSEVYALYVPPFIGLNTSNTANESNQTTMTTTSATAPSTMTNPAGGVPNLPSSSVASSQTIPIASQQSAIPSSLPASIAAATLVTSSNAQTAPPPPASVNLPPTN